MECFSSNSCILLVIFLAIFTDVCRRWHTCLVIFFSLHPRVWPLCHGNNRLFSEAWQAMGRPVYLPLHKAIFMTPLMVADVTRGGRHKYLAFLPWSTAATAGLFASPSPWGFQSTGLYHLWTLRTVCCTYPAASSLGTAPWFCQPQTQHCDHSLPLPTPSWWEVPRLGKQLLPPVYFALGILRAILPTPRSSLIFSICVTALIMSAMNCCSGFVAFQQLASKAFGFLLIFSP